MKPQVGKSPLPIGLDSGSHFHWIFFAGGGRLATAQTQSLALSSAYSKALTPLSTLHIRAPGRQKRVEWSGAERVALNLDSGPRHFAALGNISGQVVLSFKVSHLEMREGGR